MRRDLQCNAAVLAILLFLLGLAGCGLAAGSKSSTTSSLAPSILTTSLPTGVVGQSYSATLQATGGTPPYSWSIASGTLPTGLNLNGTNGAITGMPSSTGTFSFTASVSDTGGHSGTQALSITVSSSTGSAPTITTTSLPGGVVGQAYSATLQATGGTLPYSWSISVGALPTGVTLGGTTGVIGGTPSAAGTFNFTARVSGANNLSASQALSIVISAAAAGPTISTTSLSAGIVGQAYSATLQATGGTLPYFWSISLGGLPTGLILGSTTGVISGTASVAGTFNFTVQVTDAQSLSSSQALSIVITTTSGTAGCGALNGGVAPYDQSTCGSVGASFSPVGTNISACQPLAAAASYTLIADVGSGPDTLCFSVQHDTVLNLNGHTVTGYIQAGAQSGVHIYNGTINCLGTTSDCISMQVGDTMSAPFVLEYLTVTESSTTSGGRTINVAPGSFTSNLGSNPTHIFRHLTVQAPPFPTSARTVNIWLVGGPALISDIHDNLLTCPPNANACQGVTTYNGGTHTIHNNKIVMSDTTTLNADGRAYICDGDGGALNRICEFRNNYVVTVNNRGYRWRDLSGGRNTLPGPFTVHDNQFDSVRNSTEGAIMSGDPDVNDSNCNNVNVYNNTFIVGPNGTVDWERGCIATGSVFRNNTIKCASGGCSGSSLAAVLTPVGSEAASNATLKNNTLDPGIGEITADASTTANYCNSGTCGGAGICFLIPPPCN